MNNWLTYTFKHRFNQLTHAVVSPATSCTSCLCSFDENQVFIPSNFAYHKCELHLIIISSHDICIIHSIEQQTC